MSIRRSRFEIYRELLTQVRNGNCQPTRMMYSTELSWPDFNQVMKTLISQEFLVEVKDQLDKRGKVRYMITEKGKRFLKYLGKTFDSVDLREEMTFIISS